MSINLVDLVMKQVGGNVPGIMGSLIGEGAERTQGALAGAVPAILGGLVGAAGKGGETADKLTAAIKDQDGGMLDDLAGMLGNGNHQALADQGSGLLNGLLGEGVVTSLTGVVGKFSGLGSGSTKSLLGMLAPVVMSVIGREQKSGGLDAGGVLGLLVGQKDHISAAMPAGLSEALGQTGLMDSLMGQAGSAMDAIGDAAASAAGTASAAAGEVADTAKGAAAAAANKVSETAESGGGGWLRWAVAAIVLIGLGGIGYNISNRGVDEAINDAADVASSAVEATTEAVSDVGSATSELAGDAVDATTDAADDVGSTTSELAGDAVDATTDAADDVASATSELAGDAVDATTDAAGDVASATSGLASDAVEATTDAAGDVGSATSELAGDAVDATTDAAGDVSSATSELAGDAVDATTDAAGDATSVSSELVGDAVDATTDAAGDATSATSGLASDAVEATTDAAGDTATAASDLVDTTLDDSTDAAIVADSGDGGLLDAASVAASSLVGDVDLGGDLTSMFTGMNETLGGITDVSSAEAALPALEEVNTDLDGLTGLADQVPSESMPGISSLVGGGLGDIGGMMTTLQQIPGVSEVIDPVMGQITEKLSAFVGS